MTVFEMLGKKVNKNALWMATEPATSEGVICYDILIIYILKKNAQYDPYRKFPGL